MLIWQLDAHEEPVVLRVDGVSAVAVSASWIAVGTRSGETQLWNRAAIAPPVIVRGHRGAISSLAFSPDASRLASTANQDRDVFIRDGTTGAELIRLHGHAGPVHSVAWHPQGQLLVSDRRTGTFRLWNAADSNAELARNVSTSEIRRLAFSATGRLVSIANDGWLREWSLPGLGSVGAVNLDARPGETALRERVDLSSDAKSVVMPYYGRGTSLIRVLDVTGKVTPVTIPLDTGQLIDVRESLDGSTIGD